MKKGLKLVLVFGVMALNAAAFMHSRQHQNVQTKPAVAKPVRKPLGEVSFVLLPTLVKA